MATIKPNTVLTDYAGKPLKDGETEITLRHIVFSTVNATLEGDDKLSHADKLRLFNIGLKVGDESKEEAELNVDEVKLIKDRGLIMFGPILYGRLLAEIDPASLKE
jgi:hypothetical protein